MTYCEPSSNSLDDDYIARFILNTIDNTSGETEYTDFTNISTPLLPNNSYAVGVEVGNYSEYLSLWIDWNDNQVFEGSEKLVDDFLCSANTLSTTTFLLPENDHYGLHRMRVRVSYYSGADACGVVSWGEAEDYIVVFKEKITWTGATSTDWFEPLNWDVGIVPTGEYEVVLADQMNQPLIPSDSSAFAKKITIESGVSLTIEGELNSD
jgi:hypothetical protein